jgi:hypothetical protein
VVSEPLFLIHGMSAALHGLREGLRTVLEHSDRPPRRIRG